MGVMQVLGKEGDIRVEWDPDDAESVAKAKTEWKRLKADGYELYAVVEEKGKRLERFDQKLGRVIAAPGVRKPADTKRVHRPGTSRPTVKREKAMAGGPNERGVGLRRATHDALMEHRRVRFGAEALRPTRLDF